MAVVIAEVTFSPLGTATPSLSKYVAAAIRVLSDYPEVKHQLNPRPFSRRERCASAPR